MSNLRLVLTLASAAVLATACRAKESDPIPAGLPGSYVYAATGSTLKKPWQFAGRIDLKPDKSYIFTLDKTIDGEKDPTETSTGMYGVSGDHILLHDLGGDGSKDIHQLLIRPDSLIAEVGWTGEIFLKGVGAPNIVFVKQRRG